MTYISLQSNYKVEYTPSNKYKRRTSDKRGGGKAAKVWVELTPFFKKIKPQIGIQWGRLYQDGTSNTLLPS